MTLNLPHSKGSLHYVSEFWLDQVSAQYVIRKEPAMAPPITTEYNIAVLRIFITPLNTAIAANGKPTTKVSKNCLRVNLRELRSNMGPPIGTIKGQTTN